MTTIDDRRESLLATLDSVADHASGRLRQRFVSRALATALTSALRLLWLIPLLALGNVLISRIAGVQPWSFPLVMLLTVVPPVMYVGLRWLGAAQLIIDRRTALSEMDRQLDLEDRLLAADEFLRSGQRSNFMEAAIEDAVQPAVQAASSEYQPPADVVWPRALWLMPLLAACLIALSLWLGGRNSDPPQPGPSPLANNRLGATTKKTEKKKTTDRPTKKDAPAVVKKEDQLKKARPAPEAKPREATAPITGDTKEAVGESGTGVSADASMSSGDSQSRGVPSDQSQASEKSDKKKSSKKKRKKTKKAKPAKPSKKKAKPEKSGTTAGKGSAGGSSRNPTSSTWSSKDKVVSTDEEPFEDDEEVDEEESEQEARGGVQPNLRDRRPPVSRDLTIGFGNQKNPDANGRGGPSQQKKSRGVASLVLGVPVPDHVKGQPNPGKTKIHQERIEPQAEQAGNIPAAERLARSTPVGYWPSLPLKPWMRNMVREYFSSNSNAPDESNP